MILFVLAVCLVSALFQPWVKTVWRETFWTYFFLLLFVWFCTAWRKNICRLFHSQLVSSTFQFSIRESLGAREARASSCEQPCQRWICGRACVRQVKSWHFWCLLFRGDCCTFLPGPSLQQFGGHSSAKLIFQTFYNVFTTVPSPQWNLTISPRLDYTQVLLIACINSHSCWKTISIKLTSIENHNIQVRQDYGPSRYHGTGWFECICAMVVRRKSRNALVNTRSPGSRDLMVAEGYVDLLGLV